jgi:hypothetical protein
MKGTEPRLAELGLGKLAYNHQVIFESPSCCFTLFRSTTATLVHHRRPHFSASPASFCLNRETPRSFTTANSYRSLSSHPFNALAACFVLREVENNSRLVLHVCTQSSTSCLRQFFSCATQGHRPSFGTELYQRLLHVSQHGVAKTTARSGPLLLPAATRL